MSDLLSRPVQLDNVKNGLPTARVDIEMASIFGENNPFFHGANVKAFFPNRPAGKFEEGFENYPLFQMLSLYSYKATEFDKSIVDLPVESETVRGAQEYLNKRNEFLDQLKR